MVATFTNQSPTNANSSANSAKLTPGGTGISDVKVKSVVKVSPDGTTTPTGAPPIINGTTIEVSNLSPIGRNDKLVIEFTADIANCTSTRWNPGDPPTPYVWSGSSFTGDTFALTNDPRTSAVNIATLSLTQPTVAVQGVPLALVATVTAGTCALSLPPVQLTTAGTGFTTSPTPPAPTNSSGTSSFTATFANLGPATLTVNSPNGLSASVTLTVYEYGNWSCGASSPEDLSETNGVAYSPATGIGTSGLFKGLPVPGWVGNAYRTVWNKDGVACVNVVSRFDNNIVIKENTVLGLNATNLEWDIVAQKSAVFTYSANFQPERAGDGGFLDPNRSWKFQWKLADGSLSPQVPYKTCLSPAEPAPYATLTDDVAIGATDISVSVVAASVPDVPFAIVIDSERMIVTAKTSATTWQVARGSTVGGTAIFHSKVYGTTTVSKNVMSTPFPLYKQGSMVDPLPMQMCALEYGAAVVPNEACLATDAANGYSVPSLPGTPTVVPRAVHHRA